MPHGVIGSLFVALLWKKKCVDYPTSSRGNRSIDGSAVIHQRYSEWNFYAYWTTPVPTRSDGIYDIHLNSGSLLSAATINFKVRGTRITPAINSLFIRDAFEWIPVSGFASAPVYRGKDDYRDGFIVVSVVGKIN